MRYRAHLIFVFCLLASQAACMGALSNASRGSVMGGVGAPYQGAPHFTSLLPVVVFRDNTGALSYQSAQGRDVLPTGPGRLVTGRACQSGIQVPLFLLGGSSEVLRFLSLSIGQGDGGYHRALMDASEGVESGETFYDLQADLQRTSVLSVWRQLCVIVTARVGPAKEAQLDPPPVVTVLPKDFEAP